MLGILTDQNHIKVRVKCKVKILTLIPYPCKNRHRLYMR